MILAHFNRKRKNREIVDSVYRQLTSVARNPAYYADMHVPDTVMGRFEMLTLTMVLFFRRTHASGPALEQLAQDVVDTFFEDMDHSLRELGVGDVSVPKRMKKLARMFYGRAQSYGNALNDGNAEELAHSLHRNLFPDDDEVSVAPSDMQPLANAAISLEAEFKALSGDDMLAGQLKFGN